jgi:Spy/CpxP family protein refolding chaperone
MRTVLLMTTSVLLSAMAALAQQAGPPCLTKEKTLKWYSVLAQSGSVPPQQLDVEKEALAQCQAKQAELAASKAQESAMQAKLDDLRKKYSETYPEVRAVRAKLDELRAQEAQLALKLTLDPATPLKQTTAGLQTGLPDRWWKNPATAQSLGLTADQQKKMDDVFQQYRLKLIDLNAALEKEEIMLEPLVAAQPLDEAKITAQIDRVAQARAELEKANGRMLLGIRKPLTPEQWSKLQK